MIVRAFDGSLVEIKRADYKNDIEYYETIISVSCGKKSSFKKTMFTDKAVNIIKKRPYK